jgi:hypothetical protein
MPQIMENQGGYREGMSSKEQLWAVVERMESANRNGEELYLCTTDVHKAFDQVYREGTLYLLYVYGIRGETFEHDKKMDFNQHCNPAMEEGERKKHTFEGQRVKTRMHPKSHTVLGYIEHD